LEKGVRGGIELAPAKTYGVSAKRPVLRFSVMLASAFLIDTIGKAVNDFNIQP
jgi:hypothetical protein